MMDDDDDWQEMPVVKADNQSSSSSDEAGSHDPRRRRGGKGAYSARNAFKHGRTNSGYNSMQLGGNAAVYGSPEHASRTTNATGVNLDIDDARGYNWRARPDLRDAGEAGPSKGKDKKTERRKKANKQRRRNAGEQDVSGSSSSSDSSSDEEADEGGARGYTQLRLDDDPEAEDLNAATDYLFAGGQGIGAPMDKVDGTGATPHSQLNTTKSLLSEGQKIAYVGLVSLAAKQFIRQLDRVPGKDMKAAVSSATEWRLRVMARMYQHMDIDIGEQKMIESLAEHGVLTTDLAPSLVTTQVVDNPDFDPQALLDREEEERDRALREAEERQLAIDEEGDIGTTATAPSGDDVQADDDGKTLADEDFSTSPKEAGTTKDVQSSDSEDGDLGAKPKPPLKRQEENNDVKMPPSGDRAGSDDGDLSVNRQEEPKVVVVDPNTATRIETMGESLHEEQVTSMGLTSKPQTIDAMPSALEGVTTELSSADKTITLDLRWTVLCDLFLVLTADSVYDARSRVLLERVAEELQLTWMDVTKFEKRVTDALEIEESVSGSLRGKKAVRKRAQMARKRRMVMMGLATVGGGLVIGLSAGLMAPLIGAGLGAALGTIGIGGTTGFLSGVGGATIITSTGIAAGSAIGGTGMSKRTKNVSIFELKPIHNNKRVNCIIAVPGFMNGELDDVRLPFSVVDSIMGDIFSLLWEPDMMRDMGNAIYLLWNETLVQGVQQILAATIAGGLVGALAWPLWLTKLGWFIDNPWSNALDRAHSCGLILADVLSKRKLGVRPITLVGFSLGARVIFYALVELAKNKKFDIVQNVYLIGAPITANDKTWREARAVVAGRFVNAYSRTDWILGWLFRATTGGLGSIAGLRPVERVPEVENVDVTKTVPGHLQYRAFMPLVLDQLGFRTTAEYFDEPEDLEAIPEREVGVYDVPEDDRKLKTVQTKSGGFGKIFRRKDAASESGTDTPSNVTDLSRRPSAFDDDDLPPREASPLPDRLSHETGRLSATAMRPSSSQASAEDETERVLAELRESGIVVRELESSLPPLVASSAVKAKRASMLRDSVTAQSEEKIERESDDDEHDNGYGPITTDTPAVTISLADDEEEEEEEDQDTQLDSDRRSSSNVSRPYAKRFGSTALDAEELPPRATPIRADNSVNLSFSEAYDDDDSDADNGRAINEPVSTVKGEDNLEGSRNQYGLSAEAARELAMQFQSAGMSSGGALAAAQIAHNLEVSQTGGQSKRLSMPFTSTSEERNHAGRSFGNDNDPWGTMAPQIDDITPQPSAQPSSAGNSDNPWG